MCWGIPSPTSAPGARHPAQRWLLLPAQREPSHGCRMRLSRAVHFPLWMSAVALGFPLEMGLWELPAAVSSLVWVCASAIWDLCKGIICGSYGSSSAEHLLLARSAATSGVGEQEASHPLAPNAQGCRGRGSVQAEAELACATNHCGLLGVRSESRANPNPSEDKRQWSRKPGSHVLVGTSHRALVQCPKPWVRLDSPGWA